MKTQGLSKSHEPVQPALPEKSRMPESLYRGAYREMVQKYEALGYTVLFSVKSEYLKELERAWLERQRSA